MMMLEGGGGGGGGGGEKYLEQRNNLDIRYRTQTGRKRIGLPAKGATGAR